MAVPVNETFELVLLKERQADKEILLKAKRQRQLSSFVLSGKCQCISLAIFCALGLRAALNGGQRESPNNMAMITFGSWS